MDATIFFIGLYEPTSETVEVVWQVEQGKELEGGAFPLGKGFTSQVIRTGQPCLIRRWSREGPRVQLQYATPTPGLPESAIVVPLRLGEHVIGVVSVESYRPEAYTQQHVRLLQATADEAAGIISSLHSPERVGLRVRRRVAELEGILSSMADALLIVDAAGRLVRLNRAARELLCLQTQEETTILYGQPLDRSQWDQWPPGGRAIAEALTPVVEALRTTGAAQEVEVEIPAPGGGCRTLSFSATPLHEGEDAFNGGVITFRDVTESREVERLKDEMLSMASHDLKTPATVIKAQAQMLRRWVRAGAADTEDVDEGLTMIADQADRLSKLLNLLLDLSRIDAGRLELDLAPTDLRSILVNLAAAIQSTTDRHRIEVMAPTGVIGHWDQRRIEEVVQNLLGNAVKYSPGGGRIEVRLEHDEETATVSIRDPGVGIDPSDVPHLFERFYRGQGGRGVEGTGLGLYICQAIVSAHAGRIWATSDGAGRGSTFAFSLPLRPPDTAV